jgi:hypothetical protein
VRFRPYRLASRSGKGKWSGSEVCSGPYGYDNTEANFLESHEAGPGTSVRVLDGARRAEKGRVGTVERTYGHPSHLAMDVRFEDGSVELYWYHELGRAEVSSSA